MKQHSTGALVEWIVPFAFIVAAGWTIWHMPAFILDLIPPESESLRSQISALHQTKDVSPNLPGIFGGYADIIDWAAVILIPVFFWLGMRTLRHATMELEDRGPVDNAALFIGRVTMVLIISMTCIMLWEVFLRYAIEAPTLWANELTLWLAGFVFLCAGLYAMQQRCHIRIFLLYDVLPRWGQRACDVFSALMIVTFAFFLVYGGYKQVFINKFYRWEMFGTAFDPPIPATIQPAILILVSLIAAQAVLNLIYDWNKEPESHSAADDIDQEELEALKRSVGGK
ncbi:MAG: TRAP transporter small permease [Pseudomonadota bacterium]